MTYAETQRGGHASDAARWNGSIAERIEDATRAGGEALRLVIGGDLDEASGYLAVVERLVREDPSGEVSQSIATLVADLYGASLGTAREDLAIRSEYLSASAAGADLKESLRLLKHLTKLASGARVRGSREVWIDAAELEFGFVLADIGCLHDAIETFATLGERLRGQQARDREWIEFDASYAEYYYLQRNERSDEARLVSQRMAGRWSTSDSLSVDRKDKLAGAMWGSCLATAQTSVELTGSRSDEAYEALDELLAWLRTETSQLLRASLARRLAVKARWLNADESALDALEELIRVIDELDDPDIVNEIAGLILTETLWIGAAEPADARRLAEATVLGIERGRPAIGPDETGVSDRTLTRNRRLVAVLHGLAERLGRTGSDSSPALRAEALLGLVTPLGVVGRGDEAESVAEELMQLGGPTLTACDAIEARVGARGEFNAALLTIPMFKAAVFDCHDDRVSAASTLRGLIEAFPENDEPWIAAVVRCAQDDLSELLEGDV